MHPKLTNRMTSVSTCAGHLIQVGLNMRFCIVLPQLILCPNDNHLAKDTCYSIVQSIGNMFILFKHTGNTWFPAIRKFVYLEIQHCTVLTALYSIFSDKINNRVDSNFWNTHLGKMSGSDKKAWHQPSSCSFQEACSGLNADFRWTKLWGQSKKTINVWMRPRSCWLIIEWHNCASCVACECIYTV